MGFAVKFGISYPRSPHVPALRIHIITPSFNQRAFLPRTIASVLGQRGDGFDLRYHILDGGSTDGTLEILKQIDDPRVRWSSPTDRGQPHAINTGLAHARDAGADIVAWLNSDDLYTPGALDAVAHAFTSHPDTQWLAGRCEIIDDSDRVIRANVTRYKDRGLRHYAYRKLLRENFISQPAVFWRRSFGDEIGPLDESLHWAMDYDLWLRMARASKPLILDRVLAQFRIHQASKSGRVDRRQFDQQYAVASRYFDGDVVSRMLHKFHVEKIVAAYRVMRLLNM